MRSQAVALLIHHPHAEGLILTVRRPDTPGEELPGIWGLPAASCLPHETPEEAARRAAGQKLGLSLGKLSLVARGSQERPAGVLTMELYQASPQQPEPTLPEAPNQPGGVTYYTAWRWAPAAALEEGAAQGSLCCALALQQQKES